MLLVTNTFRPLLNGELSVENVLCFLRGEMNIDVPNQLSNIHHARNQTYTMPENKHTPCQKTNIHNARKQTYTCQKTNIYMPENKHTPCQKTNYMLKTNTHALCLPSRECSPIKKYVRIFHKI